MGGRDGGGDACPGGTQEELHQEEADDEGRTGETPKATGGRKGEGEISTAGLVDSRGQQHPKHNTLTTTTTTTYSYRIPSRKERRKRKRQGKGKGKGKGRRRGRRRGRDGRKRRAASEVPCKQIWCRCLRGLEQPRRRSEPLDIRDDQASKDSSHPRDRKGRLQRRRNGPD